MNQNLKSKLKPILTTGDTVILYYMEDETSVPSGTIGVVRDVSEYKGDKLYGVDWKNGKKFPLVTSTDLWDTLENFIKRKETKGEKYQEPIKEQSSNMSNTMKLVENMKVLKFFDMNFLNKYLKMVRESGITNMYGASPYLYIGREKIEQEMAYKDLEGEEFDEMLDNADRARNEMIRGTVNYLESNNEEISVENVQKILPRISIKVLETYMLVF